MKTIVADFSAVARSIEKEILALNPFFEYAGSASTVEEINEKVREKVCEALIVDSAIFGKVELDFIFQMLRRWGLKTILFVKGNVKNPLFTGFSRIKVMEKPDFTSAGQERLKNYALLFEELLEDKKVSQENIFGGKHFFSDRDFSFDAKKRRFEAVFIGVSTGGPATIQKLLSGLDSDFPVPILIAQHIDSVTGPEMSAQGPTGVGAIWTRNSNGGGAEKSSLRRQLYTNPCPWYGRISSSDMARSS